MTSRILLLWAKDICSRLARRQYWLYRLSRSSLGRDVQIHFPFCVEGRGHLSLSAGTVVHKNVKIGCGEGTQVRFGERCTIGENVVLHTGSGASVFFEADCRVGLQCELYANAEWRVGAGSHIHSRCCVFAREPGQAGRLNIGNGSHVCDNCILDLTADLRIGNEVSIGPYSIIYTHDHEYRYDGPAAWKGETIRRGVEIGDGSWIGTRVVILPGVRIGARAIVAAGAVVTRDVAPGALVGGVPARPLKQDSHDRAG